MSKVFLSAGHTNVPGLDRGASGNGYYEGDLAAELRNLIYDNMKSKPVIDSNANALAGSLKFFKQLVNINSVNIDLHFNAATDRTANGCEVLIKDKSNGYRIGIATDLSNILATHGGFKNRGVKTEVDSARGKLGWFNLTGHNFIVEICFISNPVEMSKYLNNKHAIAMALANYFDRL